ncbi:MAG: hypothetical protein PHD97_02800 [Bacteroidales bacterium]|nr:hypothetical protein [Bacteroidales bacterium]
MRKFLYIFILLNFLLTIFYIDTWENSNTTSRALMIVSLFENGNLQIDKYHERTLDKCYINNHYYSDKAPLPAFLVMPFFYIFKSADIIKTHNDSLYGKEVYILGDIICSIIPFILLIIISFLHSNKGSFSALLCMLPFYGSFIFVFAGTFFGHLMSGTLLLASFIFLKKNKFFLSGIFAGLSFLSEYLIIFIIIVWFIQICINNKNLKTLLKFSAGILPSVIFIMIYNYLIVGNPFVMLYKYHSFTEMNYFYGFGFLSLKTLWNLTFGFYRGIFIYAPFLILLFIYKLKKPNLKNFFKNYLAISCFGYIIFISLNFSWHGGWTNGPRYLIPIAILLTYEGILLLPKINFSKFLFWFLCLFGLICSLLAKFTILYSLPTEEKNPIFQLLIPNFLKGNFNENNLLTMLLGTKPLIANAIWLLLFVSSLIVLTVLFKKSAKKKRLTEENI